MVAKLTSSWQLHDKKELQELLLKEEVVSEEVSAVDVVAVALLGIDLMLPKKTFKILLPTIKNVKVNLISHLEAEEAVVVEAEEDVVEEVVSEDHLTTITPLEALILIESSHLLHYSSQIFPTRSLMMISRLSSLKLVVPQLPRTSTAKAKDLVSSNLQMKKINKLLSLKPLVLRPKTENSSSKLLLSTKIVKHQPQLHLHKKQHNFVILNSKFHRIARGSRPEIRPGW
jgi:hypothetical protein